MREIAVALSAIAGLLVVWRLAKTLTVTQYARLSKFAAQARSRRALWRMFVLRNMRAIIAIPIAMLTSTRIFPFAAHISTAIAAYVILECLWLEPRRWRRTRERLAQRDFKLCTNCGYELEGLPESGICPECGREFKVVEAQSLSREASAGAKP